MKCFMHLLSHLYCILSMCLYVYLTDYEMIIKGRSPMHIKKKKKKENDERKDFFLRVKEFSQE